MNNQRNRAISVGTALANLPRPHGIRRIQGTMASLTPKSVRIVLLGCGGVGKTAMAVRFVTERYIGDYDPTLETIYRHSAIIDEQLINFEIMDTAGQEDNSLLLEDKCKWGECFIFVYDVTDKYSFDELSRLKFIASYTHSRMRHSYNPCWILIGNKSDLAEQERMVTVEEGRALAQDLGCHLFREISVKESPSDSCEVFEDLWRDFEKNNPRLPSSSQRRKMSYRIHDKIPVISSNASIKASETLKAIWESGDNSGYLTYNLTNNLRRLKSAPVLLTNEMNNHNNNKENALDNTRTIDSIPENVEECDSCGENGLKPESPITSEVSESEPMNVVHEKKTFFHPTLSRCKSLTKTFSSSLENVFSSIDLHRASSSGVSTPLTSSTSPSSSNSSLNEVVASTVVHGKSKSMDNGSVRGRSSSDTASMLKKRRNSVKPDDLMMVTMYHEHCRRNRAR
ncbi:unnamed protein product [Clavelina lepadiformis]|uniref:small monomeric GTPase n=1 Tax=Clavelina lepadiformis TaxID=159417 RepID=A0ABP0FVU8_CLALP